jgi:hypothetical protein
MSDITATNDEAPTYSSGLFVGMKAHAMGNAHVLRRYFADAESAFDAGFMDADDDSDEPRPDDPEVLHALSRSIFAEVDRVGADVSVWPDETDGTVHLADAVTEETHEPFALLAILRALPAGAGTDATWEALAVRL